MSKKSKDGRVKCLSRTFMLDLGPNPIYFWPEAAPRSGT